MHCISCYRFGLYKLKIHLTSIKNIVLLVIKYILKHEHWQFVRLKNLHVLISFNHHYYYKYYFGKYFSKSFFIACINKHLRRCTLTLKGHGKILYYFTRFWTNLSQWHLWYPVRSTNRFPLEKINDKEVNWASEAVF